MYDCVYNLAFLQMRFIAQAGERGNKVCMCEGVRVCGWVGVRARTLVLMKL
jgi:shikimate 5-dehydrogenase